MDWTWAASATLHWQKTASPPCSRMAATVASPLPVSISARISRAPSAAKAWAVALPMPAAAPVISTTLPENAEPMVCSPERWWRSRSEEHTSELQSREKLVCRLLLEKENYGELI